VSLVARRPLRGARCAVPVARCPLRGARCSAPVAGGACVFTPAFEGGGMLVRILLLTLGTVLLVSCTDDGTSQPKMKQEAHTNAMGQTTYTYRPAE